MKTSLLSKLTDRVLSERTKQFNSPGLIGRRRPRLVLIGADAAAVGDAKVGARISLRIHGRITGRETAGQKAEAVLEIDEVTK